MRSRRRRLQRQRKKLITSRGATHDPLIGIRFEGSRVILLYRFRVYGRPQGSWDNAARLKHKETSR
jgi:hypothetical protein